MNRKEERRQHPRKRIAVKSRIADESTTSECTTYDLSANGLSCHLRHPLAAFTKVRITLMVQGAMNSGSSQEASESGECEGVVVRSERNARTKTPIYHTAIFFNSIEDEVAELIQQYVASHRQ